MIRRLRGFFATDSAGGIVLALAAALALVVANSPWGPAYRQLLELRGEVRLASDALVLAKPLLLWVNDLWMAAFFLLVGLEIKREALVGDLRSPRQVALPIAAALGGMAVPALIYLAFNHGDAVAVRGWAIPTATDIAFSLGIQALLGPRVPASLKVFLTAVAIIDDLGAIVVIALFYTAELSWPMLGAAAAGIALLAALNRSGVRSVGPYLVVGAVVWVCVLKSGVHATLAGVVTAMAIPLRGGSADDEAAHASPLERTEHALKPWITFGVLPVFAFANAGVDLGGVSVGTLLAGVPLGIALGLVAGKAVGVSTAAWLAMKATGAALPAGATPRQFLGVAVLCGIGFTMSLFIGGLAFAGLDPLLETEVKLGVLGGSFVAAALGAWLFAGPGAAGPAGPVSAGRATPRRGTAAGR